ncbi:DUF4864 domain-containing protein [Kaistia algarum]|uniref:DUF4864 domain-containing protein n=1 Tax=Kaistia algarum TaxID=2083279 RepID=UPI000CE87F18|nr:DUF4864 domain-containing protein [Kaistia algarum]MCX5515091.1 DUF4864 domain-containing protein [Kaistia algarum]PPE79820.1 DUF4864 domain-containing protein [Kaistia algarum]
MLRTVFLVFALICAAAGPLLAQTSAAPASAEWQSVVKGQIEAFRRDDGPAAYGFAAPGIQAMFPSPEIFLGMVRKAYPPVYRPSSIAFGEMTQTDHGPTARVFLTAEDGSNWIALYRFERQADGSWKISGCQILKDTAPTI